jgi:hypothetical protein
MLFSARLYCIIKTACYSYTEYVLHCNKKVLKTRCSCPALSCSKLPDQPAKLNRATRPTACCNQTGPNPASSRGRNICFVTPDAERGPLSVTLVPVSPSEISCGGGWHRSRPHSPAPLPIPADPTPPHSPRCPRDHKNLSNPREP